MKKVGNRKMMVIALLFAAAQVMAQSGANSPYSRIGIGDFQNAAFMSTQSMGSLNASYSDPFQANVLNPASLATLTNTSFELGIQAARTNMSFGNNEASFWNGGLQYLSLSFPLINSVNRNLDRKSDAFSWGMNLSLLPYSKVAFDNEFIEQRDDIGRVIRQVRGTGGTSRLNFGNGWKFKNWYAGINVGYLFGSVNNEQALLYTDLVSPWVPYEIVEDSYRGFLYNLGLQYKLELATEEKESADFIQFGLIFNGQSNFTVKSQSDLYRIRQDGAYFGLGTNLTASTRGMAVDTLQQGVPGKTKGKLPGQLRLGATYHKGQKLQLGVDFAMENWSNYQDDRFEVSYDNSWRIAAGIGYTPDPSSFNSYFKRVTYRAGIYTGNDPRVIEGNRINMFGLTAGAGLPFYVARQASFLNFGVQYENRNVDNGITSNTLTFNLGVTLNNNLWFYKRKYN